jgi:transcriptional regulator with XRE-family HTH domain
MLGSNGSSCQWFRTMVQGRKSHPKRVEWIRRLRSKGLTLAQIARRVGIAPQTVHAALKGRMLRGKAVCQFCHGAIRAPEGTINIRNVACRDCLVDLPSVPFSITLLSLRIIAGLTQARLASATGISLMTISHLERGRHKPQERTREELIAFLESVLPRYSRRRLARSKPERTPASRYLGNSHKAKKP